MLVVVAWVVVVVVVVAEGFLASADAVGRSSAAVIASAAVRIHFVLRDVLSAIHASVPTCYMGDRIGKGCSHSIIHE